MYAAPFAVFLNKDEKDYFEPDISVICDPDKVDDKGCHGAPDLVVEILSPSTKDRDLGVKLFKYRMAGVKEYWVINPILMITTIYRFASTDEGMDVADQMSFDDPIGSRLYPDIRIVLSELLK